MFPLPEVSPSELSKTFTLASPNVEITSIDITSHGEYVITGCSNGMILLFDMKSTAIVHKEQGYTIGQILAKGLHTNLLMTVKITQDCRYCFAGVHKGSSELLSIDLSKLPISKPSRNIDINQISKLVQTFNHNDAKLRGFASATRVGHPNLLSEDKIIYRLACGKGIKNIHIWQVEVSTKINESPIWNCIYDVATNGMTIEMIDFKLHGRQVISKSSGVNLRVWDISMYESDTNSKPTYIDISNTQDMKATFDNFAFGGNYNFAVVQLSESKDSNRESYEMPCRSIEDENGNRRKRMMRQIDQVIGTNDGKHVMVLCSDGGVMYFAKNFHVGENVMETFVEFNTNQLHCDPNVNQVWLLKRVGKEGDIVLLRSIKSFCGEYTEITIDTLPNLVPDKVTKSSTIIDMNDSSYIDLQWGYYHDKDSCNKLYNESLKNLSEKTSIMITKPKERKMKKTDSLNTLNSSVSLPVTTTVPTTVTKRTPRVSSVTPSSKFTATTIESNQTTSKLSDLQGLSHTDSSFPKTNVQSPDNITRHVYQSSNKKLSTESNKRSRSSTIEDSSLIDNLVNSTFPSETPMVKSKTQSLAIVTVPKIALKVNRLVESNKIIPKEFQLLSSYQIAYNDMKSKFKIKYFQTFHYTVFQPIRYLLIGSNNNVNIIGMDHLSLGSKSILKLQQIILEQSRYNKLFEDEIIKYLDYQVLNYQHIPIISIGNLIFRSKIFIEEMLQRQQLELFTVLSMDCSHEDFRQWKLNFSFEEQFILAVEFERQVKKLFN